MRGDHRKIVGVERNEPLARTQGVTR
jgi:hypothetical protein